MSENDAIISRPIIDRHGDESRRTTDEEEQDWRADFRR
jgi:hypothetical protein